MARRAGVSMRSLRYYEKQQRLLARRTDVVGVVGVFPNPQALLRGRRCRAVVVAGGTAGHGARHGRVEGRGDLAAGRTASPP
jgi:hypothetical protein